MKHLVICFIALTMMFSACKKEEDPCKGVNCLNGGECNDGTCICPTGWSGEFCETSTDPCTGVNCANGGTCVNGTCNCPPGWSGPNCETPVQVDPCDNITCQNGGTCSNGICNCPNGWTGTFCQTEVVPIGMKVTQILLTDWPSSNWDNLSGPDIYMAIYRQSSAAYVSTSSSTCDECVSSYTFTFSNPPTLLIGEKYDFDGYDADTPDSDDYMGGIIDEYPGNHMLGRPNVFQLTNSAWTMRLTVQWVY